MWVLLLRIVMQRKKNIRDSEMNINMRKLISLREFIFLLESNWAERNFLLGCKIIVRVEINVYKTISNDFISPMLCQQYLHTL